MGLPIPKRHVPACCILLWDLRNESHQDSSKMKVISERVLKEMGEYGLEIRSIANATGGDAKNHEAHHCGNGKSPIYIDLHLVLG